LTGKFQNAYLQHNINNDRWSHNHQAARVYLLFPAYTAPGMLLEKLISLVAPHCCLNCSKEGTLLCDPCSVQYLQVTRPVRRSQVLRQVLVYSEYSGLSKELVQRLKFGRTPAAAEHIAQALANLVPQSDCVLVPIRTSLSRARQRGYDQSVLITGCLAKQCGLPVADILVHATNTRQLGAKRQERLRQLRGVYRVSRPESVRGCHLTLVDDVMTTGATLDTAATALLQAGAKSVSGLVFAAA
jgi:ComF family protein